MINGNVEKIKKMALDLLNYSRQRGSNFLTCDPNVPAHEVVELMRARADKYGVILEEDLMPDMPDTLIDPDAVHRCLLDLVTNAIDACADVRCSNKPGRVALKSYQSGARTIVYRVEDTGHGMDTETLKKVFQRFFSTKGSKGTGLGLMISKKIVDEHNGEINVESDEGKGTVVEVKLPIRQEDICS